jgi:hypothetical protein
MSLFRSEEHVDRWLALNRRTRGSVMPLGAVAQLSRAWYADPRVAGWRPRTREESQAVLASVGLTDPFWTLA